MAKESGRAEDPVEPPVFKIFNLIVSHLPGMPWVKRVQRIIRESLPSSTIFDTPPSLILVKTPDPYAAAERLRDHVRPDTGILRVIPVDAVTTPYVEHVAEVVRRLAENKIPPSAAFAIKLESRLLEKSSGRLMHKREAIEYIAQGVDRRVNLDNPDVLILIKVVRLSQGQRYAAIMVGAPGSIISLYSTKWRSGENPMQ